MAYIKILDTTLRDGEQSVGVALNATKKATIANQLVKLGVDIIEAGFPASSEGDFEAVREVVKSVDKVSSETTVAAFARALKNDVSEAIKALKNAKCPRIHICIATSSIHMKKKLLMEPDEVVGKAVKMVELAKTFTDDIEFSAEDGGRSDKHFLCQIFGEAIKAGATTVNIADTVGYNMPWEFGDLVSYVSANTPGISKVALSVHCHDDLGCAVSNSLAGIRNGATQVECTVNGIGERAGNAALEEVIMALSVRRDWWQHTHGIETVEIYNTSRMVESYTRMVVAPNKAIVGNNAFTHESGIHQDGILKALETYEVMRAETVGRVSGVLSFGKHSGKKGFKKMLADLGFQDITDDQLDWLILKLKDSYSFEQGLTNSEMSEFVQNNILKLNSN